ncbi:hypothetical protein Tco_0012774 [Tanacetum coccineum]
MVLASHSCLGNKGNLAYPEFTWNELGDDVADFAITLGCSPISQKEKGTRYTPYKDPQGLHLCRPTAKEERGTGHLQDKQQQEQAAEGKKVVRCLWKKKVDLTIRRIFKDGDGRHENGILFLENVVVSGGGDGWFEGRGDDIHREESIESIGSDHVEIASKGRILKQSPLNGLKIIDTSVCIDDLQLKLLNIGRNLCKLEFGGLSGEEHQELDPEIIMRRKGEDKNPSEGRQGLEKD